MKIIIYILVSLVLFECDSTPKREHSNFAVQEKAPIVNTNIWGNVSSLDPLKEHKISAAFINLEKKDRLITIVLHPITGFAEIQIIEMGIYSSVIPPLNFYINDSERLKVIECIEKFLEWDKISLRDGDTLYKNICKVTLNIKEISNSTYYPENDQAVLINIFNDNPKKNLLEIKYKKDDSEQDMRITRKEAEQIKLHVSDKFISEKSQAYILKERRINE